MPPSGPIVGIFYCKYFLFTTEKLEVSLSSCYHCVIFMLFSDHTSSFVGAAASQSQCWY